MSGPIAVPEMRRLVAEERAAAAAAQIVADALDRRRLVVEVQQIEPGPGDAPDLLAALAQIDAVIAANDDPAWETYETRGWYNRDGLMTWEGRQRKRP